MNQICRKAGKGMLCAAVLCTGSRPQAATVTTTADNNSPGSLRTLIAAGGPVDFPSTFAGQTITLTLGELPITKNLTITGLGPTNLGIVNTLGRVFHVMNGPVTVSISGLQLTGQLTGGNGPDGTFGALDGLNGTNATGGCIQIEGQCTLTVSNCFFANCKAIGGKGGDGYVNDTYGLLSNGGNGGEACGGAICNNTGDLFLYNCAFASNSATGGQGGSGFYSGNGGAGGPADGGALCDVYGNQDILIVNCTFYGDLAIAGHGGNAGDAWIHHVGLANGGVGGNGGTAEGGAVYVESGCPDGCTGLVHDTLDQNSILPGQGKPGGAGINGGMQGASGVNGAANGGGLFFANFNHLPIGNTIIAQNFATFRFTSGNITYSGPDISGNIDSLKYNLIGVADGSGGWSAGFDFTGATVAPLDPLLGPFQNNGGETLTMAPLACSPAIDMGSSGGFSTDQVRQMRPKGITTPPYFVDGSDIGACELQSYPASAPVPLTITHLGTGVLISWPATSCFVLQQTSDLGNPNWVNSTFIVNVVGTQKQVTISPAPGNLFFRLFHP